METIQIGERVTVQHTRSPYDGRKGTILNWQTDAYHTYKTLYKVQVDGLPLPVLLNRFEFRRKDED